MIEWRRSASVAMSEIIDARTLLGQLGAVGLEQPRVAEDRGDRGPQLVRDQSEELVLDRVGRFECVGGGAHGLLGPVALGDVDEDVDRADELAVVGEERCRVGHERDVRAVRPDGDRLAAADGSRFLERDGHRTLVVAHRRLVEVQQPKRAAPFLADRR